MLVSDNLEIRNDTSHYREAEPDPNLEKKWTRIRPDKIKLYFFYRYVMYKIAKKSKNIWCHYRVYQNESVFYF